jgi:DNA-directed RNA polymerase specialized sigma24 family protein
VPGPADETGAAGHRPLLFSIAYGMTASVGDAEHIVQDAFLGLTRARQLGHRSRSPAATFRLGDRSNPFDVTRRQPCRHGRDK